MRVLLFTDTLGDVNGVSRFIVGACRAALEGGRDLHAVTAAAPATSPALPPLANIHVTAPLWSRPMPGYANLRLAWPRRRELARLVRTLAPDVIHCSTPGPVGMAGRALARAAGVPLVGVYHTDFPAFVAAMFDDPVLTFAATAWMRRFYRPFGTVITRSAAYARVVVDQRIASDGAVVEPLRPGIDTQRFHPRHRDPAVWCALAGNDLCTGPAEPVTVLYAGRVSVEKNLPALEAAWRGALALLPPGTPARLVIVGDGPYLATMRERCVDLVQMGRAVFTGFRHGAELSAIYASSDLFVFPSTTDTLGQAVLEAQASGLPALVAGAGGPPEVVRHGVTGLVLPAPGGPNAARAWAGAIAGLITDGSGRRAMARAAFDHAHPMTFEASFGHFWSIHERALAARRVD